MTELPGKCLFVVTHYLPLTGGAQTVYDALAKCAGDKIEILTAYNHHLTGEEIPGWREFDETAGYPIHRIARTREGDGVSWRNPFRWFLARVDSWLMKREVVNAIADLLQKENFTSICISHIGVQGWLLRKKYRKLFKDCRFFVYTHGEELSSKAHSRYAEEERRKYLNAADGVITVSSFTCGILEKQYGVPRERILTSTNGVNLDVFTGSVAEGAQEKLGFPEGKRVVFACGRLVPRKGFDMLLEAWPAVLEKIPDAYLMIAGKGPLGDTLRDRAQQLEIGTSVKLMGFVADEDLPSCYGLADVFAMPNRTMPDGDTEGFGLVFLEAAAMGTPSIAGRAGGAVDAVTEGETGLFVDGYQPDEIAAAVIRLLADDGLREKMSVACLAYAKQESWREKTTDVLKFVLPNG